MDAETPQTKEDCGLILYMYYYYTKSIPQEVKHSEGIDEKK